MKATFAGGCFWCLEAAFATVPGVIRVVSGYAGRGKKKPKEDEVHKKQRVFREAVQIEFNPNRVSYEDLVGIFWKQIDPTDSGGQFADRGFEYTSAIYFHDLEQMRVAKEAKKKLEQSRKFQQPIATEIIPFEGFWEAEEEHQKFWQKNPDRYRWYKAASGRNEIIRNLWSD